MRERDHQQLFLKGAKPDCGALKGAWRTDVVMTSRFVSAFPGLFRQDGEKASRRYTRYVLTRV